jgi:HEAT repeat protein
MMSRVGTRKANVSLILLAAAVTGVVFYYSLPSGEPVYQGKTLRSWLEQFGTNHWAAGHGGNLDRQAEAAIQHIGTNAVPFYLQLLTARESPLKVKLLTLGQKPWLAAFHIPSVAEYRKQLDLRKTLGAYGFVALGEKAKPFIPALIALNNDEVRRTRHLAIFALRCLGPIASEALPEMFVCLNDPDFTIRSEAATAVGEIHQESEKSVRILIDFIEKYRADRINWFPIDDAIRSLAKFGAQAKPAAPSLVELLDDPEQGIRGAATNALREIDPDAAAKAGVK